MILELFQIFTHKAKTFFHLSLGDKGLFFFAYLLLALMRLAILIFPFRWLAPWLGENVQLAGRSYLIDSERRCQACRIRQFIQIAARYTPWQSKCLVQAMTAKVLLTRKQIPYTLYLGVAKGDSRGSMIAHAWVSAGPIYVSGGNGFLNYAVVSAFTSQTLFVNDRRFSKSTMFM